MIAAALGSLPGAALAEVCANERPDWTGVPVSAWAEALALFSTPAALFLLAASAVAVMLRHQWGALAVCVLWSFLTMAVTMFDTDMRASAMTEGCIGTPIVFIVAIASLCVAMILYTGRPTSDN
ncbi:hypothetical protein G5B38_15640 [Pseudohalocynthiibacter aestuariivivens]|uniref:Uncharacterized protein n=1 Tax=Roseovarius pelagicus TaxID=2980108 RepID=A0ABY6DEW4_9RHOB|nr:MULTISPECIES: hypothetical protein [Rhodobacterales]QIE46838.1 hypothetical protein G5B38_15640 [Pseudohalocynthiibacter aestuariivivens]UXX84619.1 hypothetical protein N7U68_08275 [Roseovarius pelagicus]